MARVFRQAQLQSKLLARESMDNDGGTGKGSDRHENHLQNQCEIVNVLGNR
jgi:hypothetical protein